MEISLISLNCFLSEVKALNAYAVLNVPPTATKAEIRAAYRTLPENLSEAKAAARVSDFIRRVLPEEILRQYTR